MEHIFPHPSDEELQVLEQINYTFANRALLREALQPPNKCNEDGNKTLALVGDKVLDLVIVASGRDRNKTRGWNAYLSRQGCYLGLDQVIVKNPSQTFIGNKLMASTMEAIVGAVYLDSNQQITICADVMMVLGEHYWRTELEVSCLVWTVRKLRHMIEAAPADKPTVICTDHSSTIGIAQATNPSDPRPCSL
ncbi:hypothetical protein PENFLA_c049G04143 [Penicillium flavigenum]|uniref:RNase III domain-containing protein n=1 Tax=Penicillium flavigenum TaxID=254877 RepID=A0A1V6SHH0_9EURO|nr:hypothetical protein PENFLA_c049G04143 [Penicillium flavigenum]